MIIILVIQKTDVYGLLRDCDQDDKTKHNFILYTFRLEKFALFTKKTTVA